MLKKTVLIIFFAIISLTNGLKANGYTLVIDAGHGGHDTGAQGAYSLEKDINLKVALLFGQYVEKNCKDVNVIYTRKTDVFIPLKTRANIANRNNADLFISVHTNALPNGRIARGFEVYTLGMHRAKDNLDVAMRENSVIEEEDNYKQTYQGFDPKSSESYIMFEFMQSANMRRSVELAKMIENSACSAADRNNMGVHQAGFLVLRETSMPSCLIELGFITTPDEEDFLNTDDGVDKIAQGIYKAFVQYKSKYPGKTISQNTSSAPKDTVAKNNGDSTIELKSSAPAKKTERTIPDKPSKRVTASKTTEPVKSVAPVEKPKPATKPKPVVKQQPAEKPKPIEKPKSKEEKAVQPAKKQETKNNTTVPTANKTDATMPIFKVQIFASSRKLANGDPLLKGHKDVETYTDANSKLIKYTVGATNDYNAAVELRNNLRGDFPQAYIIAFKEGKSMELSQAINEYKKHKSKQRHNKK